MKISNDLVDDLYKETVRKRDSSTVDSHEWSYCLGMIHLMEQLQTLDKDIDLSNNNDSLKQYALSIIDDLEEDGNDLTEGCWMLQWKYDERPDVPVTLIVGEFVDIEESDPGSLN